MNKASAPQPSPQGDGTEVAQYVLADIQARVNAGFLKYGTHLKTNNGRDALWDAYQEAIDLVMYLRQVILEQERTNEMAEIETLETKQCPFCAWDELLVRQVVSMPYPEFVVVCPNCGAKGPNEVNTTRAIEMWNMRRDKFPQRYEGNG